MKLDNSGKQMDIRNIKIAVLSDLHCHAESDLNGKRESFFIVGHPRIPSGKHPVQALLDLAKENSLTADVVLCAGDIGHKASMQGLSHAWDMLRNDIKKAFQARFVFCTLGNHDVTSKSAVNSPFDIAKYIHPEFPFDTPEVNNQFWNNGFCLRHMAGNADVLIINTVHDHYNEINAKRGTFDYNRINALDLYLNSHCKETIRIALLHHHPILHSFIDYASTDVLATGDQLIDVLAKHKFNLIIHGHRHQPRIVRYKARGLSFYIFAAGSFSALLNELASRTRNLFHLIDVACPVSTSQIKGSIKTWEFNIGLGWNPAVMQSAEFPHIVNIGKEPRSDLKEELVKYFEKHKLPYQGMQDLRKTFPCLEFLLPDEIKALQGELSGEHGIDVELDDYGKIRAVGKLYSKKGS